MDNRITAMTGHEPNPGSGVTAMGEKVAPIDIESVARAIGVKNVRTVNSFNQKELQAAIREFSKKNELSVIVSKGMCRLLYRKIVKSQGGQLPRFRINSNMAKGCVGPARDIACPAISIDGNKAVINEDMCLGCSLCVQACPPGAVVPVTKFTSDKMKKDSK